MPLLPSTTRLENTGTPVPSADTAPRPVMATRRTSCPPWTPGEHRAQPVDCLAYGSHRLRRLIRHDDLELVLEGKEQVGGIERVDPQLLERAGNGHPRRIELFLLRNDRDDLLLERVGHDPSSLCTAAWRPGRSYRLLFPHRLMLFFRPERHAAARLSLGCRWRHRCPQKRQPPAH